MKNEDLKQVDVTMTKPSIEKPPELELKDLPSHIEYAFLEGTAFWDIFRFLSTRKTKKRPPSLALMGRLPTDACLWACVMLWERPKGHKISKSRIEVDKAKVDVIAKLPHRTSVKGVVLGQRKTKYFQPIHYASKTMTDAQAHYTTTEKELLVVVYAFEKLQPYLILLLQKFDVVIRDKKGAKNLAADYLSRLENPHQGDLEKKKINETFPLETLGMISSHSDSSTSWFADISNYHAGNFIVKGMSSQQKKKIL
nr:reverse transcriptase domain-containing protein [Tanacetum cinerariifolium]